MVKLILRDYRLQWKENLSRSQMNMAWITFYIAIFPLWNSSFNVSGCYYACMVPMLFGWILAEAFPNEMSKAMLLCPLSEEEKRRYISTGYWLRVLCPTIMELLFLGSTLFWTWKRLQIPLVEAICLALGLFFNLFAGLIAMNINCRPISTKKRNGNTIAYELPGHYNGWRTTQIVLMLVNHILMYDALFDRESESFMIEVLFFAGLMIAELALCIKIIITYRKPVMEKAIHYEYRPIPRKGERKR